MDPQFSKYAVPFDRARYKAVRKEQLFWDRDHHIISLCLHSICSDANPFYNRLFCDNPIPFYDKVLVCGAGPSFDHIPKGPYDAVVLTPPIAESVYKEFDCPIIVADGEYEGWIGWLWYPELLKRPDIVKYWPREKYVEDGWGYLNVLWAEEEHPRSSGALALDFARRCGATDIDVIGIDLTGHYEKFRAETEQAASRLSGIKILGAEHDTDNPAG